LAVGVEKKEELLMPIKRCGALPVYALVGMLSSIPWFVGYIVLVAVILHMAVDLEWLAPGVLLLSWFAIGWGSSLLSGLVCRLILVRRDGIAPVALANSSGWVSLVYVCPALASHSVTPAIAVTFLLIAVVVSVLGLLITWTAMSLGDIHPK
jgi:hypothetical protein